MRVLGIDPCKSRNLGFCLLTLDEGGEVVRLDSGVHFIPTDDPSLRLLDVHDFVVDLILDNHVTDVAYERSIGGGFGPTREALGETCGAIRLAAAECHVTCHSVQGSSASKLWTGSGKSSKPRTMRVARERFWRDSKSYREIRPSEDGKTSVFEHEADAMMVSHFVLMQDREENVAA